MDDPVAVGALGDGVVAKALADGVGWVDGRGPLALGHHVRRGHGLAHLNLLS